MTLRFGSVCSGIEAASVAWHVLGWKAAWFSEIEPFPCAVLNHHYPDVPNLGDMTAIADKITSGEVEAPDMLCGGTPCQAFSVAGQRRSLDDARGNLSLVFCELADAIDDQRFFNGQEPCVVFWENVPGVLSTSDNAFGCFLGQLAGEDCAIEPPGGKWTDAGAVFGPKRAIAWRVLDAQYFGLAQRRKRVFVVSSARKGFDPAAILFEFDGVRRDSAPSREPRKDTTGSTGDGVARCVTAGEMKRQDWETCNFVAQPVAFRHNAQACQLPSVGRDTSISDALTCSQQAAVAMCATGEVFHTLRAEGFDASEDGTGRGAGAVAVALRGRDGGATAEVGDDCAFTLRASTGGGDKPHALTSMAVRRLTPRECERLQGFPDDYTAIPWKRKPADQCPDGPRYKALGNSWAVPCVRWIGARIDAELNKDGGL